VNINESSVQILNLTAQFLNPFPLDQPSVIAPLRKFIYRNSYVERSVIPKNPGSRLLLLFLIAAGILFIIDIIQYISYSLISLNPILSLYESQFTPLLRGLSEKPIDPSSYQLVNVLKR
jgi:hypothetical protein